MPTWARLASAAAAATVSAADWSPRPMVGVPSLINTIAAGGTLPSAARGTALMALNDDERASPVAVPPVGFSLLIADSTMPRSAVGATSTPAMVENDTRPSRTPGGRSLTKRRAAFLAAARRLGATSSAIIDLDVSRASITVACLRGVRTATDRLRETDHQQHDGRERAPPRGCAAASPVGGARPTPASRRW